MAYTLADNILNTRDVGCGTGFDLGLYVAAYEPQSVGSTIGPMLADSGGISRGTPGLPPQSSGTGGRVTGTNSGGGDGFSGIASELSFETSINLSIIMVAIVFWISAMYLLYVAETKENWAIDRLKDEKPPKSSGSFALVLYISFLIFSIYFWYIASSLDIIAAQTITLGVVLRNFLKLAVSKPEFTAVAFLIASIMPSFVGILKFNNYIILARLNKKYQIRKYGSKNIVTQSAYYVTLFGSVASIISLFLGLYSYKK